MIITRLKLGEPTANLYGHHSKVIVLYGIVRVVPEDVLLFMYTHVCPWVLINWLSKPCTFTCSTGQQFVVSARTLVRVTVLNR